MIFVLFFCLISFTSLQSTESIFNGKNEANLNLKLNDISSMSLENSRTAKLYNHKTMALNEDKELEKRKKREVIKKPLKTVEKEESKKTTTQEKIQTTTRKPVDKFEKMKNDIMNEMNKLRKIHHVGLLKRSIFIGNKAQEDAENLAKALDNFSSYQFPTGPLSVISSTHSKSEQFNPMNAWLCSSKVDDVTNPSNYKYCHAHTQIIWKNTKQVGCGIAESMNLTAIVCEFYPKGNIEGKFEENVFNEN